jgi:hypothetical protein
LDDEVGEGKKKGRREEELKMGRRGYDYSPLITSYMSASRTAFRMILNTHTCRAGMTPSTENNPRGNEKVKLQRKKGHKV